MNTRILMLTLSFIAFHTVCMDQPSYPQLQLEQPKAELPVIRGTICIGKQARHTGFCFVHEPVYHPAAWDREYLQQAGIHVSVYDPCLPVEIKLINSTEQLDNLKNRKEGLFLRRPIIPVKNLVNLSTKSILHLNLYGHQVELVCENNPLVNNKPFRAQFEKRMKKYYGEPLSWANVGQPVEDELIPAGIIIKIVHPLNDLIVTGYDHGPNGCPNDLALAKLAAEKNLLPYNKSMHRFIIGREIGQMCRIPQSKQVEHDSNKELS